MPIIINTVWEITVIAVYIIGNIYCTIYNSNVSLLPNQTDNQPKSGDWNLSITSIGFDNVLANRLVTVDSTMYELFVEAANN